jgi:hypothetical protein
MDHWLHCFWASGLVEHHGRKHLQSNDDAHLMVAGKQREGERERGESGVPISPSPPQPQCPNFLPLGLTSQRFD